ncbi:MAG TPA: isoprenylcysteine carboxylmethyltransferase family protein [Candidatus Polarisedimenticolia bacterium]|nr:isoprenylcysteine carboxylmethyltransferase family protein [Candidatus Polarisedimenticolia bacterium]
MYSRSVGTAWIGFLITFLGMALTWWARVYLGRNWSGTVTLKEGHELVRTGPYRLTRHPIYTGLILALAGTALARDTVGGWLGLGLIVLGFVLKLRGEERLLTEHFGEAYRAYQAEVPQLIPGLKAR